MFLIFYVSFIPFFEGISFQLAIERLSMQLNFLIAEFMLLLRLLENVHMDPPPPPHPPLIIHLT